MPKREVEKTETGIKIKESKANKDRKQKAKSNDINERIEAKLDLILDKLGIEV